MFDFYKVKMVSHSSWLSSNLSIMEQIAYIARVSNPSNTLTSKNLCEYLLSHSRVTPFEVVYYLF